MYFCGPSRRQLLSQGLQGRGFPQEALPSPSPPPLVCPQLSRQYGSLFTIHMGSRPVVVLCGYQTVKEALVDRGEEFSGRGDLPVLFRFTQGNGESSWLQSFPWGSLRQENGGAGEPAGRPLPQLPPERGCLRVGRESSLQAPSRPWQVRLFRVSDPFSSTKERGSSLSREGRSALACLWTYGASQLSSWWPSGCPGEAALLQLLGPLPPLTPLPLIQASPSPTGRNGRP